MDTKTESDRASVFCFSHLRWNFVYQRPQHLLTRCQTVADVHFWEEPVCEQRILPALATSIGHAGVRVLTPLLPDGMPTGEKIFAQRRLLLDYLADLAPSCSIAWYYTPMALQFSDVLSPDVTLYDCMDELAAFFGAPPELIELETQLFRRADVVFTGGKSLFASKRSRHHNVHLFPSSVDREHFAAARRPQQDPADQARIPHPRVGFFGVIDERLDHALLRRVASDHPEWHFIFLGPVVKIREDELPRASNIHYLGKKDYSELPTFLANWDVAMLPFALNASTRFISPTKTPEYLAAGKPVVSTPIKDVIVPYGEMGLVKIGANAQEFASAIEACLAGQDLPSLESVDTYLASNSWDKTFNAMWREIQRCVRQERRFRKAARIEPTEERSRCLTTSL